MPADKKSAQQKRDALMGLGSRSISKSYYPELRARLNELERFRTLMDDINDAILVLDPKTGEIKDVAGAAEVMTGCDTKTLLGMNFRKLFPPMDARKALRLFNEGKTSGRLETIITSPLDCDQPPIPVELSARLSKTATPMITVVARDISERKAAEEALRRSHLELEDRVRERTRELRQANQAKNEFLSVVSHELRTPLTSILGFARIIRKKLVNRLLPAIHEPQGKVARDMGQVEQNLDVIVEEGDRLTALINDLLDLAKLEAGRIDYNMTCVSMSEIIQRSAAASLGLFKDNDRELSLRLQHNLPKVLGDTNKLVQVMLNLFSNAVKFSDNGPVTCSAWMEEGLLRVKVADTGMGIPEDKLEAVFEKFTQANDQDTLHRGGTGLGLPISRHIIQAHNGRIWAQGGRDKGTAIIFALPPCCEAD